ncbi:uncharacterized [Tachysurus ichikawai]
MDPADSHTEVNKNLGPSSSNSSYFGQQDPAQSSSRSCHLEVIKLLPHLDSSPEVINLLNHLASAPEVNKFPIHRSSSRGQHDPDPSSSSLFHPEDKKLLLIKITILPASVYHLYHLDSYSLHFTDC